MIIPILTNIHSLIVITSSLLPLSSYFLLFYNCTVKFHTHTTSQTPESLIGKNWDTLYKHTSTYTVNKVVNVHEDTSFFFSFDRFPIRMRPVRGTIKPRSHVDNSQPSIRNGTTRLVICELFAETIRSVTNAKKELAERSVTRYMLNERLLTTR